MDAFSYFTFLLIFVLGSAVGSFLCVLVDRLPREESVLLGRSYCEKCKKKLGVYDLIPVFSFVLLKAKCRYCHTPLSFYYPIVEILTGIMFVFTYIFVINNFPSILSLAYYLFMVSSLIVVFFADLKYGIIPDKIIFPSIVVSMLFLLDDRPSVFANHLLSAVGAFLFLYVLMVGSRLVFKKEGMGEGDVKFAILMGLILGFPGIVIGLYLAFLTGAIVGVILILCKVKKIQGSTIPFGPFLVFSTLLSFFQSAQILKLISGIF